MPAYVALIAALLAVPPLPQDAPATRAAVLAAQRQAKAQALHPYEPTVLERLALGVEDGRLRRLIAPHNGFFVEYGYTHKPVGSGIGIGGGFRHDLLRRQARVELEAGISVRNYQLLRADVALPRLAGERLEIGLEATFRRQPQDDFFGLGQESSEDGRVNYQFEGRETQGRAVVRPVPWLRTGLRVGRLSPSIGRGRDTRFPSIEERFDEGTAPGLATQPDFVYGELFGAVDYRDEPGNARQGGYYSLASRTHADSGTDRYGFRSVDLLLQQFVPVFDKKRVFAFQLGMTGTRASAEGVVPFYMRPTVGGSRTLRSVRDFRFRDTHALWFNAEYRWEAFGLLDMALFTDWARVAPSFSGLDLSGLQPAYGVGFRFNTSSTVFLRLDVAGGAGEGLQTFFKFSKAF